MTRYIARCKKCSGGPVTVVTSALAELPLPEVGSEKTHADRVATARATPGVYSFWGNVCLNCRACGSPRYAKAVNGTFRADKKCTARCQAATGFDCECACAGKNHGAAHAA